MSYGQRIGEKAENSFSCSFGKKTAGGGGSPNPPPPPPPPEQKGYVILRVKNANSGSPVENASVYANGVLVSQTSPGGVAYFPLNQDQYNIKIEAPGFSPTFYKIDVQKDTITSLEANLLPYRFSTDFDTSSPTVITDRASGVKISLPGGGLKKQDNSLYFGKAYISIAYLNPYDPLQISSFPGNFVAERTNGEKVLLETFGPIEVRITSESGEILNLPDGVSSEVIFPIQPDKVDSVPDIVPLWYFDESKAEWKEEGVLVKQVVDGRYVLKGYVYHFSWWNPDIPSDTTCIKGVLKDENGNYVVGAQVWSEGVDYQGADWSGKSRRTDSQGRFFTFVRKNSKANVFVYLADGRKFLLSQVNTPSSPSYYYKDWLQNPDSAWTICQDIGEFTIGSIKVILRWGNKSCDLDLHITGPNGSGGRFHVATKLWGRKIVSPYVEILGDDYPEVVSISPYFQGVYRVSVFHNNPNDTNCGRLLKDSGALIQVWKNHKVIATVSPPSSGSGNLWKAFDMLVWSGGITITPIGEIVNGDYCSPYHPDPSFESACPSNSPPTFSASVPSSVEGGSIVFIPLTVNDPDGDNPEIKVLASGDFGRFMVSQENKVIGWEVADVYKSKTVSFTIVVDDLRGGVISQTYNVSVIPTKSFKIWEFASYDPSFGRSLFDIAMASDSFFTVLIGSGADYVVKFSKEGKVLARKAFSHIYDIALGDNGVYIAWDAGGGIFVLSKYNLDLSSAIWEVVATTSGRSFMAVDTLSDGVVVAFVEGGNYVVRKYTHSGSVVWATSFPKAGNYQLCWVNCLRTEKTTGETFLSIYEDYLSGQDYQKIFRVSSSGVLLGSKTFSNWALVPIYPLGTSIYVIRNWTYLEIYDLNFNLVRSLNICSDFSMCEYWIVDLHVSGDKIFALGQYSIYNDNFEWVKDSLAFLVFDLGFGLKYYKNIGVSLENIAEYGYGIYYSVDSVFVVGEYHPSSSVRYPFALRYYFK
ncbi:hypothetical protein HRbin19_01044 [bacterium HR19]|nr:hypothetical protein HRbin19_01044 [bacterium HR19]